MPSRQRLLRFLRLAILALGVVLFLLLGVLPVGIGYSYSHQLIHHPCRNPSEPLTQRLSDPTGAEQFTFSPATNSAVVLEAWFFPGTNGAGVIVLSGAWGGYNTMYEEMEFLHAAGYSVLTYDTRSCAHPPQATTLGYAEIADLEAAIDILSQHPEVDPQRIGVMGHSMGGATALMGAARDARIHAVVSTGNYAALAEDVRREKDGKPPLLERWIRGWIARIFEWQADISLKDACPLCDLGKISPRPVFLIYGSLEQDETRAREQFAAAGEPKDLWIVAGAGHGEYSAVASDQYQRRIIAFFNRYLLNDHQP